jgi:hypothetical protein
MAAAGSGEAMLARLGLLVLVRYSEEPLVDVATCAGVASIGSAKPRP